jgi:uroporphyrinogen decarboxylase
LKPRERVTATLSHKEPDRIPIDFGGGVSSIMKRAYINLCNYLNINHKDAKCTIFDTVMEIDERILRRFNVDFRRVWLGEPLNSHIIENSDGSITDIFGIKREMVGEYMEIISPPLNGAGINDIKNYKFPDPEDKGWLLGVEEKARSLSENSNYAVVLGMSLDGVFESGTYLFGFEDFLIKLYTEKKLVNYFFDKLIDFETTFWSFVLKKIGQYIDIIELGDDMANQRQLFFSKEIYREMIKLRHISLFNTIKEYTGAKLFLHCCGSVTEIIDELIEVGIDILNPVQPSAYDMRAKDLKDKFGNRICFHGGIDEQHYLPKADMKEFEEEVKRVISEFAPDGGYILAPAHNIQSDTSPEKIVKLYETAITYGTYPFKMIG